MGHSFFSHDIIGGQMGRMGGGCLLAPVFCGCVCVTDRQIKVANVCWFTKYKPCTELFLAYGGLLSSSSLTGR